MGAFFGPAVSGPFEVKASDLRLEGALLVCRFGDHGLYTGRWQVIDTVPNWSDAPWSVTRFVRRHDNSELCYVSKYDEALNAVSEQLRPAADGNGLPHDAQYGSGVVEEKLSRLLAGQGHH